MILAIDPGPVKSAFVWMSGREVCQSRAIIPNEELIVPLTPNYMVACEWIESFGMAVGKETFETVYWIGQFAADARTKGVPFHRVTRKEVKRTICGTHRATDANIRAALIDLYGGKEKAIGSKRHPGPLYGIKSHLWSALAVGWTFLELEREKKRADQTRL